MRRKRTAAALVFLGRNRETFAALGGTRRILAARCARSGAGDDGGGGGIDTLADKL